MEQAFGIVEPEQQRPGASMRGIPNRPSSLRIASPPNHCASAPAAASWRCPPPRTDERPRNCDCILVNEPKEAITPAAAPRQSPVFPDAPSSKTAAPSVNAPREQEKPFQGHSHDDQP